MLCKSKKYIGMPKKKQYLGHFALQAHFYLKAIRCAFDELKVFMTA
jgi:hypothetical protein